MFHRFQKGFAPPCMNYMIQHVVVIVVVVVVAIVIVVICPMMMLANTMVVDYWFCVVTSSSLVLWLIGTMCRCCQDELLMRG